MEIELKYTVDSELSAKKIFDDKYLNEVMDKDSYEIIPMKAIYFDTPDGAFCKEKIAFRVRSEGSRIIATVKWRGSATDGMHIREEINVPVCDEKYLHEPDVSIFSQCDMAETLKSAVGDSPLIPLIEMIYIRKQVRVDTGKSISVISMDTGEIKTSAGNIPVCELEIELYSGSQDDMRSLGNKLADRYNLKPENRSKYKRGLDLIK